MDAARQEQVLIILLLHHTTVYTWNEEICPGGIFPKPGNLALEETSTYKLPLQVDSKKSGPLMSVNYYLRYVPLGRV